MTRYTVFKYTIFNMSLDGIIYLCSCPGINCNRKDDICKIFVKVVIVWLKKIMKLWVLSIMINYIGTLQHHIATFVLQTAIPQSPFNPLNMEWNYMK